MKKRLLAIIATVAMVVAMMPSMVFGATTLPADVDGTITLTEDVQLDGKLVFTKDTVVDLGGKTLVLKSTDNYVTGENTVTFKNGMISLEPTSGAGNGIICVGKYNTGIKGTLILDNVTVVGKNISSGAGTIFLSDNSTLEVINGSEIIVENESSTAAYVIYSNNGLNNTVNIKDSKVAVTNGNSGIYSGKVTIENSEINLDVKDNGINTLKDGMELVVISSEVDVTAEKGRAITLYGTSSAEFKNDSKITLSSDGEAAVRYKGGTTGKIKSDETVKITLEGNVPFLIDDKKNEPVTEEVLKEYMELPSTVKVSTDGSVIIDGGNVKVPGNDSVNEGAAKPEASPNTGDNTAAPFAVAGLVMAAMAAAAVARRRYN